MNAQQPQPLLSKIGRSSSLSKSNLKEPIEKQFKKRNYREESLEDEEDKLPKNHVLNLMDSPVMDENKLSDYDSVDDDDEENLVPKNLCSIFNGDTGTVEKVEDDMYM
jgi:hypothetical protein